jgi:hypothetical protein
MCNKMPANPVNTVVVKKRIIGKNEGPRRRRGSRGRWPKKSPNSRKRGQSGHPDHNAVSSIMPFK